MYRLSSDSNTVENEISSIQIIIFRKVPSITILYFLIPLAVWGILMVDLGILDFNLHCQKVNLFLKTINIFFAYVVYKVHYKYLVTSMEIDE